MTCKVCHGKKLIPFVNKKGNVVSHAFQDCPECTQNQQEHYTDTLVPHWCAIHRVHFFKTSRMYSYAHPITNTGKWCSEPKVGGYRPLLPEDFDFPISYDYYRGLCQLHGWPDPGSIDPPQEITDHSIITHTYQNLQPIKDHLVSLQNRLNQHIDAGRKPQRKQSSGIEE